MTKIYYFLLDEECENQTTIVKNENCCITIVKGKKEFLTTPRCGQRAHTIYLDRALNTRPYQNWIDEVIKPMCSLHDSQGVFFI